MSAWADNSAMILNSRLLLMTLVAWLLLLVGTLAGPNSTNSGESALGGYQPSYQVEQGKVLSKPLNVMGIYLDFKKAALGFSIGTDGTSNTSRFDDIALEGQQRQQELLDSNQGYNISGARDEVKHPDGSLGNTNPPKGPDGGFTFLTDKKAFEDILGELPANGSTVRVNRAQINELEDALGLNPGSLDTGSVLRQVDNVKDLAPASPLYGNEYFRGPGNHLPNEGPEIVINPTIPRVNNPNITSSWTIEVID